MNDFDAVIDSFYVDAPPYCNNCGHFHPIDSACPRGDCGSFLCCSGLGDNDED